jgi:hypothetical protein
LGDFVVKDTVERATDKDQFEKSMNETQMSSSWAQNYGLPSKTGTLVKHQLKMKSISEA